MESVESTPYSYIKELNVIISKIHNNTQNFKKDI